jgi:regulator of RNase E activity RraA
MSEWNNDRELFDLIRDELFSCVVGDIMDKMGRKNQYLPPAIRALQDNMRCIGRAMTVLESDCASTVYEGKDFAFGRMFEALDSLKESDVYICSGASPEYACWGELMTERALFLKAAGAVLEGYSRDTKAVIRAGFPVFSLGPYGQDQGVRGRVIDFNCRIKFKNQAYVNPGDLILADIDGVVCIPQDIEQEVVEAALTKVRTERSIIKEIRNGKTTQDIWRKYQIM